MGKIFKDYPMQLHCLNEGKDLDVFHTEAELLLQALQYRGDRAGLKDRKRQISGWIEAAIRISHNSNDQCEYFTLL